MAVFDRYHPTHPILERASANYGSSKYILLEQSLRPLIGNACPAHWTRSKFESFFRLQPIQVCADLQLFIDPGLPITSYHRYLTSDHLEPRWTLQPIAADQRNGRASGVAYCLHSATSLRSHHGTPPRP